MEQSTAADYGTGYEALEAPWWLVILEGIVAIIIGIFLLYSPGITTIVLLRILAIFWLLGGIISIIGVLFNRDDWFWKLLSGVLSIIAGALVLMYPILSPFVVLALFVIILGVWAVISGAIKIAWGLKGGGWGVGILGVLTLIIGILLLSDPLAGTLALPWLYGLFLVAGGIGALIIGFKMRS
ncbi:hypothetical protein MSMTP_1770 [Methanosarcina sp. MTP4]|uniref:HdeD family acid-resistance protein n=1 Tax=Methanosarcina sp. MTP4 TaxID=1434100 RepID=UPI000616078B|nr:HdeD family acid-resistance protein [Methanosarcina sp. MTP4]AKB25239.1 hypothetical protein MSMTP_1770 [Methanosarcina sp. MTP4]